jgi:pilus assembly protein CpaE
MSSHTILVAIADSDLSTSVCAALEHAGLTAEPVASAEEAFERLPDGRPLVAIVGEDLADDGHARVIAWIRDQDAKSHQPTGIISVSADATVESRIAALRAGADDSLSTPIYPAELAARVKGLLVRRLGADIIEVPAGRTGRIVAFYGARGGVGTTTVAINTAVALSSRQKRRVVLVDGNLRLGDHRVFLDLANDRPGVINLVTETEIDPSLVRGALTRHDVGIDALLAPLSPEEADLIKPEHIDRMFEILRGIYDDIIVDLDRGFSETSLRILDIADKIIVVMTPDLVSLKNARLLLSTMASLGYESSKVHLLLNRVTSVSGLDRASVENAAVRPIEFRLPNDYKAALAAINHGTPFIGTDTPLGRGIVAFAAAIDAMAEDGRVHVPADEKASGGRFLRGLRRKGGSGS